MAKEYYIKLNTEKTTISQYDLDTLKWYISDDGKLRYSPIHRYTQPDYIEIYKDFLDKFNYIVSALLYDGPYTSEECDEILKPLVDQINTGLEQYGVKISGIKYCYTAKTFTDNETYYEFELDEEYVIADKYIRSDLLDWLESHNISYTDFLFDNRYIIIREDYKADRVVKKMIESGIIDIDMIDNYEEVKELL